MNRVNFKGCVEKDELLKILQRLWKQEQRNKENVDNMDDDSLCKICMDSPVRIGLPKQVNPIFVSDRLRDAGVRSHVHMYKLWQTDG